MIDIVFFLIDIVFFFVDIVFFFVDIVFFFADVRPSRTTMKVAVIGGGPGGLATLKFLSTAHQFFPIAPIEARLFEAEDQIGGTFVHRVYEDAEVRIPWPQALPF